MAAGGETALQARVERASFKDICGPYNRIYCFILLWYTIYIFGMKACVRTPQLLIIGGSYKNR